MATTIYTPAMLRGAGTRGVPEIPVGSSFSNTYSMEFDGADECVDCGNNSSLQPTTSITLSCWMKETTLAWGYDTLIGQDHSGWGGTYNGYELQALIHTNNLMYLNFIIGDGTATQSLTWSGGTYYTDTWYHVMATFDGSTMKVFVNGVEKASSSVSI